MSKFIQFVMLLLVVGCANRTHQKMVYYDLEGINHAPGMIWVSLMRPGKYGEREIVKLVGHFGTSSIEIASRTILDPPLIVQWSDSNGMDYSRPFPFQILPPLDTANQKYHLRFTFYPNDSVKIQARAVAKTDCRHTVRHGATAEASFGPCIDDRGWSNTLDSIHKGLIHHPWKGPMDIPGWD